MGWEVLAAGIGASAAGVGTISGGRMNRRNREWAERQNEITRQREDTAIQRRAADLRAAGLNPLLAVGEPAHSQVMPAPREENYPFENMMQGLQATNFSTNLAKTMAEIKLMESQAAKNDAEAGKIPYDISESLARVNKIFADNKISDKQLEMLETQIKIMNERHPHEISKLESEYNKMAEEQKMIELEQLIKQYDFDYSKEDNIRYKDYMGEKAMGIAALTRSIFRQSTSEFIDPKTEPARKISGFMDTIINLPNQAIDYAKNLWQNRKERTPREPRTTRSTQSRRAEMNRR